MDEARPGIFQTLVDVAARKYGFVREEKQAESIRRAVALISNVSGSQFGGSLTSSDKSYSELVGAYRSWVYTSIDRIAKSVATLKLKLYVYRAGGTRQKVNLPVMVRAQIKSLDTEAAKKRYLIQKNLRREEIDDHPFLELIAKPNPLMTRFTLWYETLVRLELAGSCPWYVPRNRMGLPGEIWPLPIVKSATVVPVVSAQADIISWTYRDGALVNIFPAEEISFLRYPHPGSPFVGMSPLLAQTEPYDIDMFLSRRQRNIFENQAVVGLNLATKERLSEIEAKELLEFLDMQYSGITKAGGNLVTHSGLEARQLSMSNRDAMIGEVGRYAREKLITSYDLSEGKLGLVRDVNRANMEALNETFILDCLKPKTMLIEENIEADILPMYDEAITADFVLPDIGDKEYELKAMETRLGTLVTVINEERELMGKEPVEWGDKPWAPFNLVQIGEPPPEPDIPPPPAAPPPAGPPPGGPPPATPPPKEVGDTPLVPFPEMKWEPDLRKTIWENFLGKTTHFEQIATTALQKHFRMTRDAVLARLNKFGPKHFGFYAGWSRRKVLDHIARRKKIDEININRALEAERLRAVMRPIMVETVNQSGKMMQRSLGLDANFNVNDPAVLGWLGERMSKFSNEVSGTTFDEINEVLRDGFAGGKPSSVIADELRHTFDVADKYRAPLIARTEIASGSNKADLLAIRQSGVQKKLLKAWLSAQDGSVRTSHITAEGKYGEGGAIGPIPIDGLFKVGQDTMESPGGGGRPEENINCRCTMIYVRKDSRRPLGAPAPTLPPRIALPPPPVVRSTPPVPPAIPKPPGPRPVVEPDLPEWAKKKTVVSSKANFDKFGKQMSGVDRTTAEGAIRYRHAEQGKAAMHEALDLIDSVHDDGPLGEIPFSYWEEAGSGTYGRFARANAGQDARFAMAGEIQINIAYDPANLLEAVAHESGHWLDNQGILAGRPAGADIFTTRGLMSSDIRENLVGDGILAEWWTALTKSEAWKGYKNLQTKAHHRIPIDVIRDGTRVKVVADVGYVDYAASNREMWARSYAQYISEKTGNENMKKAIAVGREHFMVGKFHQWDEDDFAPIKTAFDNLFEKLGWAK